MALTNDGINRLVVFARRIFVVKHEKHSVRLPYCVEHILRRGNGQKYRFGLVGAKVHHVVRLLGNTNHIVGGACDIDALSDRGFVIREKRLCHLITDDAHLTTLVAVELVDISAGNDSLGRHGGEER